MSVHAVVPADISTTYTICLEHFRRLLAALNDDSYTPIRLGEFKLSKALESYGRLRTWGEETRAVLPASSRGSLDDTLRKNEVVKETVVDILIKLERQLQLAIKIRQSRYTEPIAAKQQIGEASDKDESSSSSSDSSDNDEPHHIKVPRLRSVFRHITEDIDSLYQLSLLITRPGFDRKYLHSTRKTEFDARVAPFYDFEFRHVEEKLQEWKQQKTKVDDLELVVTPEIIAGRSSDTDKTLIRRLATANTKRREQLFYWSEHPDRLATELDLVDSTTEEQKMPDTKHLEDAKLTQRTAPLGEAQRMETESQQPRSIMTKYTFSNAAASDIFGTQTVAGPARTIYAESTVGNKQLNRVPPVPPVSQTAPSFECPYCHITLDSQLMHNRQEWKRHVFRDLRPYICTFESCDNPDKQYLTRRDWVYHETQVHRRQWVCEEHAMKFQTPQLFTRHIAESHPTSITEQQLPILVEMSERQMDEMETVACPLCPDERRLLLLQNHIAEHLESIALFILSGEADQDYGEDSQRVAVGRTSSKLDESSEFGDWSNSDIDIPSALNTDHDRLDERKLSDEEPPQVEDQRMNNLAQTLSGQGRLVEAAQMYRETLTLREKALGKDHPDTLTSVSNLGSVLERQGEYEEAEKMHWRVLEGIKKILGVEQPHTITSVSQLGSLLWRAAENGHEAVVELLLNTGKVDVNLTDEDGRTPLSRAAENGHEAIIELLLNTGKVDVNLKDKDGETPLWWAAENGHEAVVELLLNTGKVDVNLTDEEGGTPLSRAAENGHEAVVRLLLNTEKVNVNLTVRDGRTPLSWAAENGHEAVVELLLNTEKVDVDWMDGDGRTPLSWAAGNGHEAVVKLLLIIGEVDVDLTDGDGRAPLSWAAGNGHEVVVKLLLITGEVDVDLTDGDGRTALSWAAENGHEAVVKLLLNTSEVDVGLTDGDGRTTLSWAAENGHEAVVKLLLNTSEVEVDLEDDDGRTALSWAAENGHEAVIKLLLNTGKIDVNLMDRYGRTPLWWAAVNGYEAVVKLLLNTGKFDVNLMDKYGRSPLWWATENGHEAVVKLLQKHIDLA